MTLDAPPSAGGAMDGDQVYVPLQSGQLVALARESGEVCWSTSIETHWPPLVAGTRVVVASDGALHGLDTASGRERWVMSMASLSAPLSAGADYILAVTSDGDAIAVRPDDGTVVWTHALGGAATQPATAAGGLVVVAIEGSRVVALHAKSGDVAWTRTLEGTLSPPAAARDRILIGSTTNVLYALEPKRGEEAWKFPAGGDVIGAAVDGDVVYFVSLDNILRAVNRGSGNQRWKMVMPTRPVAAPVAFDGVVVLSGVAPRVDGYDGRTGKAQGSYTAPADLQGGALIDRLMPYRVSMVTISRDGRVSAVRSQPMMMRDPATSPLSALPGRRLGRERQPSPAP